MGEDEDVDVESDDEDIDTKADQDLDDSNDELNEMRSKLVHPRPLFGKVTTRLAWYIHIVLYLI